MPVEDPQKTGAVAAIDCGTNSTRLLIVDANGTVLERRMHITRLGEGVDASRVLSPEAVTRTVQVLRSYKRLMDDHGVARARLVATSAIRDASNAQDFSSAVLSATGLAPEVLSGDEEGRLAFAGAVAGLDPAWGGKGSILVADIGGGSTELVAGRIDSPAPPGVTAVSLDMGCVRVSERFFHHDPPLGVELEEARAFVDRALVGARPGLGDLPPGGVVVGLAGTVSTLAMLEGHVRDYDREQVHHSVLERAQVESWLERLAGEDRAARLERPGMVEGREDVIVGGVLVLVEIMGVFDCGVCLVSEDDILDGLAQSLRPLGPLRAESVRLS